MLVAAATSISAAGGRKARGACCPVFCPAFSKAGEMFPTGNRFTFFSLLRKEPKVAQRVATLWTPRDGSKLYRLCFFVTFPSFVPKPVYGATRFSGCFEPVRKGYSRADARPIFFENGMSYCKLTGASRIRKG